MATSNPGNHDDDEQGSQDQNESIKSIVGSIASLAIVTDEGEHNSDETDVSSGSEQDTTEKSDSATPPKSQSTPGRPHPSHPDSPRPRTINAPDSLSLTSFYESYGDITSPDRTCPKGRRSYGVGYPYYKDKRARSKSQCRSPSQTSPEKGTSPLRSPSSPTIKPFQIGADPSDPLGIAFPPVYDAAGVLLPWVRSPDLSPEYAERYRGIDAASFRHTFEDPNVPAALGTIDEESGAQAAAFASTLFEGIQLDERQNVRNVKHTHEGVEHSGMLRGLVTSVCIYNLTDEAEERELVDIFSVFGPIDRLTIVRRPGDESSQNYALCTFEHRCHALEAYKSSQGEELRYQNRRLCVLWPSERYRPQQSQNVPPEDAHRFKKSKDVPSGVARRPRAYSI